MKQIFLISGLAESGKDSVAKFMSDKLDGKTIIVHNADYLKYIAQQYMGWDGNKDDSGRTLLQWLGTDKIRLSMQRPLYWIERSCDIIEILSSKFDYFIIPDTRFKNEIYYPKARFPEFVTSIRIIRLDYKNKLSEKQRMHISEIDLMGFHHDHHIRSKSGLQHLELEVDKFINQLK